MARKRLNKKVAIIGSAFFLLFLLLAIGAVLYLTQGPEKFIKDGDLLQREGDQATDPNIKEEKYEKAAHNYHRARSRAKTDELQVDILFKLVDLYLKTDDWRNILGCWNRIIQIDSQNIRARYARLKYVYITADGGAWQAWKEVASQVSDFIEIVENNGLFDEQTVLLDSFEKEENLADIQRLGPLLYLFKGRAYLEITKLGEVTDLDESLKQSVDNLQKVIEYEPNNVEAHWYLAQAINKNGEILASRGRFEERQKAVEQAHEILKKVITLADDNPQAHINLIRMQFSLLPTLSSIEQFNEQIDVIESKYKSLTKRFESSPEVFSALASFYYQVNFLRRDIKENLDKAIKAIEKTMELKPKDVSYARRAAELYYQKFSVYHDIEGLNRAIKLAESALELPGAQDVPGPHQRENLTNRHLLYTFLANCYIGLVLEPVEGTTQKQNQKYIAKAEQAVHQIEQLYGSGEEPQVRKWRGMLDLARAKLGEANKKVAVRKLYETYEQLKASGRSDAKLSYTLAQIFKDSSELGAVMEFYTSAINAGIDRNKPGVRLDYIELLLRYRAWKRAVANIDIIEKNFGTTKRIQMLRIQALIEANQFDEAEKELVKTQLDDANDLKLNLFLVRKKIGQFRGNLKKRQTQETIATLSGAKKQDTEPQISDDKMSSELKKYRNSAIDLIKKQVAKFPNLVKSDAVMAICNFCITENKVEEAKNIVNKYLEYFPDDINILFYKQLLLEPEPNKISQQRRIEIREQALSNLSDPIQRSVHLGLFYQRSNEPNKAVEEFQKVLNAKSTQKIGQEDSTSQPTMALGDLRYVAANGLFEVAIGKKDWESASQILDIVRQNNMDDCEGAYFAARLLTVKEEYQEALAQFDECIRQRPVFSYAYMLRSNVNSSLGNDHAALEDIRKAVSFNPIDPEIRKRLAITLFMRNQKLGDSVSHEQLMETKNALMFAISLNPEQWQLRSLYAEYISEENPSEALAMQQRLLNQFPTADNAVRLGILAKKIALNEFNAERKKALFAIAESSFEQARAMEPQNMAVLEAQAEFYRLIGQEQKAETLLTQSEDKQLLWRHYLRAGRFENARQILRQLYQHDANDKNVVGGLLVMAEKFADENAAKRYSEELLAIEDSIGNRLFQAQTFLKIGLVKEAEYKIASLKEKYPADAKVTLLEAWLAIKQGKLNKAFEQVNKALEADSENATAWRLRGQINLLLSNYDLAVTDFKKSKLLSDDPIAAIMLAKAYMKTARQEDAITELKVAIENPQAIELLEQLYWQLGRTEDLRTLYTDTIEKFPDDMQWHEKAASFFMQANDLRRAEQLYEQVWQSSKKAGLYNGAAFDGYLRVLNARKKFNEVFEQAGEYVDGDYAAIAFLGMAEAKKRSGDKDSAVRYCRKAVEKAEDDQRVASLVLQRMYSLLGRDEMLKYAQEKIKENPDSFTANFNMYNMMKMKGDYNKAVYHIDKCIESAEPNSPHIADYITKKVEVLMSAFAKTSDNNYLKKSISAYESLLEKVPNNMGVLNNLAYILLRNDQRLEEALSYAKRAYEAKPNDPTFLDTYAYALYKNGKYKEASEFIHAALQQYEQRKADILPEVYEHLGMITEKLGKKEQAVAAYKQALEKGTDKLTQEVKQRLTSAIERLSQ